MRAIIARSRDGLPYSVPLMLILLCHELGHYFVARLHGVDASLPYFIPLPPVRARHDGRGDRHAQASPTDRKKLIDIGAAGPLAGLVVAIPVHRLRPHRSRRSGRCAGRRRRRGTRCSTRCSSAISRAPGCPTASATSSCTRRRGPAWAGLLVTMINLLPIGQLDGGHIATAYFGNRYNVFARRLHRLLPVGGDRGLRLGAARTQREAARAGGCGRACSIAHGRGDALADLVCAGRAHAPAVGRRESPAGRDKPLPRSRRALFWLMVLVFVGDVHAGAVPADPGDRPPAEPVALRGARA